MLNLNQAGAQSGPIKSSVTTTQGSLTYYLDPRDLGESLELGNADSGFASTMGSQYAQAVELATAHSGYRELEA